MTEPTSHFEDAFAARLRAHLDGAVAPVDAAALTTAVIAEVERTQPLRPAGVRWSASPPVRWRPIAAVAAVLVVTLGVALLAGAPDRPSPSPLPTPTTAVVVPSMGPSAAPNATERPGLRRLASNGRIAWGANGGITLVRPDGSGSRTIAAVDGAEADVAWSPFGDWIAFVVADQDLGSIGRVREDGSGAELLTGPGVDVAGGPIWSPDGAWLAFTVREAGNRFNVVAFHVATRRTTVIGEGLDPAWAGDSRRLVFVQGEPGQERLAIGDVEGRVRGLTNGFRDGSPDWSPVDDTILFDRSFREGTGVPRIMAIEADGTGLRDFLSPEADVADSGAGFDPFGERVAFNRSQPEGGPEGYVADADGKRVHDVDGPGRWVGAPWSPDGRYLLSETLGPNRGGAANWAVKDADTGALGFEWQTGPFGGGLASWQPLMYAVSCGEFDEATCRALSISLATDGLGRYPDKRLLSIGLSGPCGRYEVVFTDGTSIATQLLCR